MRSVASTWNGPVAIESRSVDGELLALFGSSRYDRLNRIVHDGVIETYKRELTPCCSALLENERTIGQYVDDGGRRRTTVPGDWYKDPHTMSTFELFRAIGRLESLIEYQERKNASYEEETKVLRLAMLQLQLQVDDKFCVLELKERDLGK
jgi:hypothetical protein